jgi:GT2 family glycosyltransferase
VTTRLDLGTVVLNWNGIQDTLACLASIYEQQALPAYVVLVDNGSTDRSVETVREWIENHQRFAAVEVQSDRETPQHVREFALRRRDDLPGQTTSGVSDFRFVIIENESNLGFAAGNNVGIRLLLERGVKYVLLLNNDTLLGEEAFAKLVQGMDRLSACECMVPQIRYADEPDRIWNCGARWTWLATPRYYYAEANVSALDGVAPFDVEMVSGCALIIRSAWLATHGLLSERFFFGEEDIELSWRMRAMGKGTMFCLPEAVIYHKVGASLTRKTDVGLLPKVYIGYLNRMIFLRSVWGNGYRWHARRILLHTYFAWKLIARMGLTPLGAIRVVKDFARDSLKLDGVDADFFSHLMNEKFKAAR